MVHPKIEDVIFEQGEDSLTVCTYPTKEEKRKEKGDERER